MCTSIVRALRRRVRVVDALLRSPRAREQWSPRAVFPLVTATPCAPQKGKELSDEECVLLASTDTWRYVIFPSSGNQCCRYCNSAS